MAILFYHLSIATRKYTISSLISVVVSLTQFFILEVLFVKTCGNINRKNKCISLNNYCIHNLTFAKIIGNEGGYDPRTFGINYMKQVSQDFIDNYIA